jgi:hypothetical protein
MVQQARVQLPALQQQQQASAGLAAAEQQQQQLDVLPHWQRRAARIRSCGAQWLLLLLLMLLWSRCLVGAMQQGQERLLQQVRP